MHPVSTKIVLEKKKCHKFKYKKSVNIIVNNIKIFLKTRKQKIAEYKELMKFAFRKFDCRLNFFVIKVIFPSITAEATEFEVPLRDINFLMSLQFFSDY